MVVDASGIGLLVGLATLGGLVWKMGGTASEFKATVQQLREEVADLKGMRKNLDQMPLLAQRLEQIEDVTRRLVSDVAELSEKRAASEAVRRWKTGGEVG